MRNRVANVCDQIIDLLIGLKGVPLVHVCQLSAPSDRDLQFEIVFDPGQVGHGKWGQFLTLPLARPNKPLTTVTARLSISASHISKIHATIESTPLTTQQLAMEQCKVKN